MNELDGLRQEAETLKNAIRVSTIRKFEISQISHIREKVRFAEKSKEKKKITIVSSICRMLVKPRVTQV